MKRILYPICFFMFASCGERFLDVRPSQRQRVPSTVADYLGLLDRTATMNLNSCHYLGVIGSDEMTLTEAEYNAFPSGVAYDFQRNAYTWEDIVYEGGEPANIDWTQGYERILLANVVLEGLDKLAPTAEDRVDWRMTKGMALFYRALNFYNLAQLYCVVYDAEEANASLGLPLRLSADVTEAIDRATLQQTYDQVIQDLEGAGELLPDFPEINFRPSKWAVYALLARVYLQMGNYASAGEYASRCIDLKGALLDYNSLDWDADFPISNQGEDNPEMIFISALGNRTSSTFYMTRLFHHVEPGFVERYDDNDLRKAVYFKQDANGMITFSGNYYGTKSEHFTGLALDEVFLIKAECHVRLNEAPEALQALNELRAKRHLSHSYTPLVSTDPGAILDWIIAERRKELIMRGTRWEDLRRLNKEPRYETALVREIGGETFRLPPGDLRWIWPLPTEAVEYGGYQQNER